MDLAVYRLLGPAELHKFRSPTFTIIVKKCQLPRTPANACESSRQFLPLFASEEGRLGCFAPKFSTLQLLRPFGPSSGMPPTWLPKTRWSSFFLLINATQILTLEICQH